MTDAIEIAVTINGRGHRLAVPPRRVLAGLSALVVVSDVIGGLAPGIGVMLAARAVLGMCVGGFWVFGAGAAISLVSERARGTAVAVVSSGIFLATVASLPAASLIGTLTTWRAAFAVAAVFAVIAGPRAPQVSPKKQACSHNRRCWSGLVIMRAQITPTIENP